MKKTLIVLTAIVLCASLLFGCSPAAQTPPPDDTSKPEVTPAPGIEGNAGENAAEEEPTVDDDASDPPEDEDYADDPSGAPVLVYMMNQDYVEVISDVSNPDGTYQEQLIYDAVVFVSAERRLPSEFGEEAATIAALAGVAEEDLTIYPYELPELKSYPAFRAEYMLGENEDSRYCVDVLIHIDGWDYLFHTETSLDWMEDYSDIVEDWISTLTLF